MGSKVLVLNSGSSSLKFKLFESAAHELKAIVGKSRRPNLPATPPRESGLHIRVDGWNMHAAHFAAIGTGGAVQRIGGQSSLKAEVGGKEQVYEVVICIACLECKGCLQARVLNVSHSEFGDFCRSKSVITPQHWRLCSSF